MYTSGDTLWLAVNDSASAKILSDLKLAFDAHQAPAKENVKAIATALAIPFPFGIIGLHRIYLGCPPWVPIVYLVTFGGCFGILPLVDCIVLLTADEATIEKKYKNNTHFFMWVN
jgi:TM2 domain-containing membrane protein YozV